MIFGFLIKKWRRKCQPTPIILPGESRRQRRLVGCRLWGLTELDTTEVTQQQQQQQQQFFFFFFLSPEISIQDTSYYSGLPLCYSYCHLEGPRESILVFFCFFNSEKVSSKQTLDYFRKKMEKRQKKRSIYNI